jgi:hypothetical protein
MFRENIFQRSAKACRSAHINCRLKIFRILAERYRNRRRRFGLRFNLIAAILNSELAIPS